MTERTKSHLYDLVVRVAVPLLIGVSSWTFMQLWSHEGRLLVLETQAVQSAKTLDEIKGDVKKLLERK